MRKEDGHLAYLLYFQAIPGFLWTKFWVPRREYNDPKMRTQHWEEGLEILKIFKGEKIFGNFGNWVSRKPRKERGERLQRQKRKVSKERIILSATSTQLAFMESKTKWSRVLHLTLICRKIDHESTF